MYEYIWIYIYIFRHTYFHSIYDDDPGCFCAFAMAEAQVFSGQRGPLRPWSFFGFLPGKEL